jgi:uncharacterized protein with FMN-binding domain
MARPNPTVPAPKRAPNKRIANNLVALSSVAILSVYGVGYVRTQGVANAVAAQEGQASASVSVATQSVPTPVPTTTATRTVQRLSTATEVPISSDNGQGDPFATIGQSAPVFPTTAPIASAIATVPAATATVNLAPTVAPSPTTKPAGRTLTDGTYVGTGFSRHGDIEATVVINGGKIVSADVTMCGTRYSCSKVTPLVREVVSSQTAPVDLVSGATDSSYAYHDAVIKAISQAA